MIKNIIFDWSGVINDDLVTVYNAAMIIFKRYGAKEMSLEEFKREWEQPYMIFYNKYMPGLSKEDEDAAYRVAYKEAVSKYPTKPYSRIKDVLQKFKKAGINMIVLSSNPYENLLSEIEEFGLKGLFNEVYGEVHDKSEIIHEIIEKNQFNPKETIFIGDTTHEIKAGKSANIRTATVTWGYQNEDKLKSANPDFIIHNLKELESVILNKESLPNLLSHGIVALIIKADKYLLLKDSRKAMLGYWAPPHGVCEAFDQCEEDCVVREILEETTLKIKPIKKLWTTEGDTKVKTVSFWMTEIVSGEIKINKEESSDYGWFSLDEVIKLKLYPGTKRFFQLVKEGKIKI